MEHVAQAVDPFVFRLSIIVLAVFVQRQTNRGAARAEVA